MKHQLMQVLRAMSLTEGVSYLLLLFIAMPLKYGFGMDMAVTIVGWAHGALFIMLALFTLAAMVFAKLPFKLACYVAIASLVPGGPFFLDRHLKQHQATV
jgi:integral membrane protein